MGDLPRAVAPVATPAQRRILYHNFGVVVNGVFLIFFSRPQITRKPLILLAQINLRNPHDDGRRENFFGATAQPHTNRTMPQAPHLWRHLSRRGARGRGQPSPPGCPRLRRFGRLRASSGRSDGRTGKRPTGRTDGEDGERTDTQATRSTDETDGRQRKRQARTTRTILDTFRDSVRHRSYIPQGMFIVDNLLITFARG